MGFRVTGIDPSEPSLAAARQHAQSERLAIDYRQGTGESIPFADGTFPVVYCCDVLEHVRDLPKVIGEIYRVTKPGGVFFFDTINRTFVSKLVAIKIWQEWKSTAFMPPRLHEWRMFIRPEELEGLLVEAGFEFEEFRGTQPNVSIPRDGRPPPETGEGRNRLQGARAKLQAGRKPGYEDSVHGLRRETGAVIRVRTLRARAATWHLLPPCTPSTSSCLTSTVASTRRWRFGRHGTHRRPRTIFSRACWRTASSTRRGIEFSRGLAEPDDPALTVRDLTGAVKVWIEIGAPNAERLHRATRAAPRVVVYTHKEPAQLVRQLEGSRIHRADSIELYAIDREFLAGLAPHLERRVAFSLSVIERQLYLTINGAQLVTEVQRHRLDVGG